MPAQVHVQYPDRSSTPVIPVLVHVRIAVAAKCTVEEPLMWLRSYGIEHLCIDRDVPLVNFAFKLLLSASGGRVVTHFLKGNLKCIVDILDLPYLYWDTWRVIQKPGPPPDADNRSLKAKLTSEMSQPMHKCSIPYELNYINGSSTTHLVAMAMHTCTSTGIVDIAGLLRYRTCTWAGIKRVCKESTTATIAISVSSNFKPILNGLFNLMGIEWRICMRSPAETVFALYFKYAIERERERERERVGMGPPTLQISDKSVKICSNCTYQMKESGFRHSNPTCYNCLIQQCQKPPTGIW